jgi:hypothetical protein
MAHPLVQNALFYYIRKFSAVFKILPSKTLEGPHSSQLRLYFKEGNYIENVEGKNAQQTKLENSRVATHFSSLDFPQLIDRP